MAQNNLKIPVFRKTLRGYDPEQVDAFTDLVQERFYSVSAENLKLKERLSVLLAEGKKRGVEEEMRRREIDEIREEAERLLRGARERADELVREAEREAEKIRRDAETESEELLSDTRAYMDEAKEEALALVKERDAMLSQAEKAVRRLREILGEEYERAIGILNGAEDALKSEEPSEAEGPAPEEEEPVYEEPAPAEEEPVYEEPAPADDEPVYEEPAPADDEQVYEEPAPADDEPVYEEPAPADDEPFYEEPAPAEEEPVYEEPAPAEEEPVYEEPAPADDEPVYEEPAPEEDEPVYEEPAPAGEKSDPDFSPGGDDGYREYDLDEILRGLEYMTSEKAGKVSAASEDPLPEKDDEIVDALKKKFGEPAEEPADESDGDGTVDPDDLDFYDEEHEDGEEFDPNDYTRFFK